MINVNASGGNTEIDVKDVVCKIQKLSQKDILTMRNKRKKTDVEAKITMNSRKLKRRKLNVKDVVCKILKLGQEDILTMRNKLKNTDTAEKIDINPRKINLNEGVCKIEKLSQDDILAARNKLKNTDTAAKAIATPLVYDIFRFLFKDLMVYKEAASTSNCGQPVVICKDKAKETKLKFENRRNKNAIVKKRKQHGVKQINIGDYVKIRSVSDRSETWRICKVISILKDEQNGMFHGHWLIRSSDTVLSKTGVPNELFLVDNCDDINLACVIGKCNVRYKRPSMDCEREAEKKGSFFYKMWYDEVQGRFEEPPEGHLEETERGVCISCLRKRERQQLESPILGEKLVSDKEDNFQCIAYGSFLLNGVDYRVGDTVYLSPEAFYFEIEAFSKKKSTKKMEKVADEDIYPEYYRKSGNLSEESNFNVTQPYRIGEILAILSCRNADSIGVSYEIELKVRKFYRPENIYNDSQIAYNSNFNELYWSSEEAVIGINTLRGPCSVVYAGDSETSLDCCLETGRFYFKKAYNSDIHMLEDIPHDVRRFATKEKTDQIRSLADGNAKAPVGDKIVEMTKLRTLDIFAGCGGLSVGLHQSGVVETVWAIENDKSAAQAFRANNPQTTVFTDDCNVSLRLLLEGKAKNPQGQMFPKRSDVDMICGGPPCQGFSQMNRFSSRKNASVKNSLVVTFLSYCDYYRPKYIILENVRSFFTHSKSMVLKLTLKCLLKMGYQCSFGVLQAGSYGVPQKRRRALIMAAAPGNRLPEFPQPTHCFGHKAHINLSVIVDGKKYYSKVAESAPYRSVRVRDAISDLPKIKNNAAYYGSICLEETKSHFQRQLRGNVKNAVVYDHVCKHLSPLPLARIQYIPVQPGSDWRNIPNVRVRLSDGTKTKKLKYLYVDRKNGTSSTGRKRGVCRCANGKSCDPGCRQQNTLIPWSLPHTSNRHSNWKGIYGRLDWDGFFSTTVTNPEPMSKQGRVLHPSQDRVVSVRECARSQGFSDQHRFVGQILEKYRQIGNAVPPPLAKAIGLEIKKCLVIKQLPYSL